MNFPFPTLQQVMDQNTANFQRRSQNLNDVRNIGDTLSLLPDELKQPASGFLFDQLQDEQRMANRMYASGTMPMMRPQPRYMGGPVMRDETYKVGDAPPVKPVLKPKTYNILGQELTTGAYSMPQFTAGSIGSVTPLIASYGGMEQQQTNITSAPAPPSHTGLADFYRDNDPTTVRRYANGGLVPKNEPAIVGDQPMDPATRALMDSYASQSYSAGNGPLPETFVGLESGIVQPVGTQGEEVIVPKENGFIIPNPNTERALNLGALPPTFRPSIQPEPTVDNRQQPSTTVNGIQPLPSPMSGRVESGYVPIGETYASQQAKLAQKSALDALGIRQPDLRRYMQTPQGIAQALSQRATTERDAAAFGREKQLLDMQNQTRTAEREAAKAQKQAEEDAAAAAEDAMAAYLGGSDSVFTRDDIEAIRRTKGSQAKAELRTTLFNMRQEQKAAQTKAQQQQAAQAWTDVPGNPNYMMNGQGQVLPKPQPAQPELTPEQIKQLEDAGYNVTRKVGNATISKPQTQEQAKTIQRTIDNGDGTFTAIYRDGTVGIIDPSAPPQQAPAANSGNQPQSAAPTGKTDLDRYFPAKR